VHFWNSQALLTSLVVVGALVQAFLVVVMHKRNQRSTYPVFFAYNAFASLSGLLLAAGCSSLGSSSTVYFYSFWVVTTALMLFEFGVVYEMFVHAVKPYAGLTDLVKLLFRWAAAFLLLAAALTAFATSGVGMAKCIQAVVYLSRGLRLMECGMLLLFFLFERKLNLSWRSPAVAAALGLSTCAAIGLGLTFFRAKFQSSSTGWDLIENGAYLLVVSGWVWCFQLPAPARRNVLDSPSRLIFQRWNETLITSPFVGQGNLAMASADSFLPNVERAVERVMARKMTQ
jgi:hypothetical protein